MLKGDNRVNKCKDLKMIQVFDLVNWVDGGAIEGGSFVWELMCYFRCIEFEGFRGYLGGNVV